MRKIIVMFLVMVGAMHVILPVQAREIKKIDNTDVIRILNNYEVMYEETSKLPYAVRVLRVTGGGECAPNREWCPDVYMYIAVSTFDEAPDQAVYILPIDKKLKYVRVMSWPEVDGKDKFVKLLFSNNGIKYDQPTDDPNNIVISFNPYKASAE